MAVVFNYSVLAIRSAAIIAFFLVVLQETLLPATLILAITTGCTNKNDLACCSGDIEISSSVTSIADSAFEGCSISSVVIPNSVVTIGSEAFKYCSISSVVIPNSVVTIGDDAFIGCYISSVVIPNSVVTIGSGAFMDNLINSLSLGGSVKTIEGSAFSYNQLTSVELPNSMETLAQTAFGVNSNVFCLSYSGGDPSVLLIVRTFRNCLEQQFLTLELYNFVVAIKNSGTSVVAPTTTVIPSVTPTISPSTIPPSSLNPTLAPTEAGSASICRPEEIQLAQTLGIIGIGTGALSICIAIFTFRMYQSNLQELQNGKKVDYNLVDKNRDRKFNSVLPDADKDQSADPMVHVKGDHKAKLQIQDA